MGNSACEPLHHRRPASVVRRTQRLGPCPLRGCPGAQELLDHRDLDAFACGFQQVACMPVHVRTGRQQQCNGRSIASIARVPERHVDMHCIGASRQQHRHDASVTSATRSHKRTIRSIWVAASADTGCEEPLDNGPLAALHASISGVYAVAFARTVAPDASSRPRTARCPC